MRADPAKVKEIVDWPVPKNLKDLRKWLGLANYLHKCGEVGQEFHPVTTAKFS